MSYNLLSYLEWDENMWENCVLPPSALPYRDTIFNKIVGDWGMAEPIWQWPHVFKKYAENWFAVNYDTIQKLFATLSLEYNPIENYDRKENSKNHNEGGYTNTNDISAMNSTTYQPDNKQGNEHDDTDIYESRIHGNIGVTTTQQMITQERVLARDNLIEWVSKKFGHDNMVLVF